MCLFNKMIKNDLTRLSTQAGLWRPRASRLQHSECPFHANQVRGDDKKDIDSDFHQHQPQMVMFVEVRIEILVWAYDDDEDEKLDICD